MTRVFVIFYHKIVPRRIGSEWGFNVALKTFHNEIRTLKNTVNIITLDDVYEYLTTERWPNRTSVVISFDDGYADNYVYAYPLLQKHGLKAAIFPVTSRINRSEKTRPTLRDYWDGKVSLAELHQPVDLSDSNHEYLVRGSSEDFLTSAELNTMIGSFEIGGHTSTHMKVFYKDEIQDFFDGGNGHWSNIYAFNEKPEIGFPLFPTRGDLSVKRGFLKKEVKDFIKSLGGGFALRDNWKEKLKRELENRFTSYLEFETEDERARRVNRELQKSKRELKNIVGQEVRHFSYPFGDYDETLAEICSKYFLSSYTVDADLVRKGAHLHKLPRIAILKGFSSFLREIFHYRFTRY